MHANLNVKLREEIILHLNALVKKKTNIEYSIRARTFTQDNTLVYCMK